MNKWNQLLSVLDALFGFTNNKTRSRVFKRAQAYDNNKREHVIWLEYRVVVDDSGVQPQMLHSSADDDEAEISLLRGLLESLDRSKPNRGRR